MSTSAPSRSLGWLVAAVAVAGGIGFALGRDGSPTSSNPTRAESAPAAVGASGADENGGAEPLGRESPARDGASAPSGPAVARPTAPNESVPRNPETRQSPERLPPIVIPSGTRVELELVEGVSSQSAAIGDPVHARLASPVLVDGEPALAAGTPIHGRVTGVRALRRVGGQAELALAFESAEVGGESVPIEAYFARTGRNETRRDAAAIAAGTIVGTVLGNQAEKNDRGKVVGGLVGAGVGTAIAAATEGEAIELGAGARLGLTLRGNVEVRSRH